VKLLQNVVRDVTRGPGLAVQKDRDVGVAETDFLDKRPQFLDGLLGFVRQFVVVHGQDERRRAALLLGERRQVAVACDTHDLKTLCLDGAGQRPDAES